MNINPATKIVICGPTASGKSALAFELAKEIGGVIINFDSQQIYKELPIMSAQPSLWEQKIVPHYLYSQVSGKKIMSVAKWLALAEKTITSISTTTPIILVGGTGLYLNSLIYGLSPIPEISRQTRNLVKAFSNQEVALQLGNNAMGDSQRLRRRLEVKLATGKDLEWFFELPKSPKFIVSEFKIYNLRVSRETTYASINARLESMLKEGGMDEIQKLYNDPTYTLDLPMMKACGVPEMISYLKNEYSFEEALNKAKQSTRNYAKRQITWFKHKLPDHKVDIDKISVDFILKDLESKRL